MRDEIEIVALNFPPNPEREQYRIEKGKSTALGLVPTSMVDNGPSVLVTFKVANENAAPERYSENDKVQKEYMKGQLENVEKIKREKDKEKDNE